VAGLAKGGPVVAAGEVTAARTFDLDDPRAEVSELTGGEGGGHGLLK
jgi:translation initiation factor 2 gamma subunit (eIF-2gamma)